MVDGVGEAGGMEFGDDFPDGQQPVRLEHGPRQPAGDQHVRAVEFQMHVAGASAVLRSNPRRGSVYAAARCLPKQEGASPRPAAAVAFDRTVGLFRSSL